MLNSFCMKAQECTVAMTVLPAPQAENIPSNVIDLLGNRLSAAVAGQGVIANQDFTSFFISAKLNTLYKETVPGPPIMTALTAQITLYIGDVIGKKVFSTLTLDVKGAGNNLTRAYMNALRTVNANNPKVQDFIEKGKAKIINYFEQNYKSILAKARQRAGAKDYEAALYYATSIPSCCSGFEQASQMVEDYYSRYVNYNSAKAMQYAQAEWAQSPDAAGAARAMAWLVHIEAGSISESEAKALTEEISTKMKRDWDFENREKYKDDIELQKSVIEAAKSVGVAYGNGQQPTSTNLLWLK